MFGISSDLGGKDAITIIWHLIFNNKKMDIIQGYKTYAGLLTLVLTLSASKYLSADEINQTVFLILQVVGLVITVYGFIMKLVRKFKK